MRLAFAHRFAGKLVRSIPAALAMAIGVAALRSTVRAQGTDSAMASIERRIASGDRAGAHALADSLLGLLPPDSRDFAIALWWRAATATSAVDAERDYRRLSIEYPLSPRAADALLNLAQLEYARRDRAAARRHFEQLLMEHGSGVQVAKASYWIARLSLDDGDTTRACAALTTARATAPRSDVELSNQIEYYSGPCARIAARDSSARDTTARADSARAIPRDSARTRAESAREFTIQVAAFDRRADATALAASLKRQGFSSRVFGLAAPYRVRVGRYPTPEAAASTLAQVRRTHPRALIRPAEPR